MDHSIGCSVAPQVLSSKSALEEIDDRFRPQGMQIRLNRRRTLPLIVPHTARGDIPVVASRIFHASRAFAICLIGWLSERFAACLQSALICGIASPNIALT